jgi:tetratricopeptide (TPR) repeat protein
VGVGAVVALAVVSAVVAVNARRWPALAFGWAWFVVAPLPVIGLVQFGGQAFADRWSYLPHLGLAIGVAWTLREWLRARGSSQAWRVMAATVIVACAARTAMELPHWRTSEALFRHTLAVSPNNFMAHTNLANALDAAGRLDEAAEHYEEAVRLNPTYPEALNNLGTLRARTGRMGEAEALFRRALAVRPGMLLARYNLGLAEARTGRPVEAATEWMTVLAAEPRHELTRPSLRWVTERVLEPGCAAGTLRTGGAPGAATAFATARGRWQAATEDVSLREALGRVEGCLAAATTATGP